MKARVKATEEIIEVSRIVDKYIMKHHPCSKTFDKEELDFEFEDELDYWERLKHQAAISVMQGIVMTHASSDVKQYARLAVDVATALVEKLKEGK